MANRIQLYWLPKKHQEGLLWQVTNPASAIPSFNKHM